MKDGMAMCQVDEDFKPKLNVQTLGALAAHDARWLPTSTVQARPRTRRCGSEARPAAARPASRPRHRPARPVMQLKIFAIAQGVIERRQAVVARAASSIAAGAIGIVVTSTSAPQPLSRASRERSSDSPSLTSMPACSLIALVEQQSFAHSRLEIEVPARECCRRTCR